MNIAIIAARFNKVVCEGLLAGALRALRKEGIAQKNIRVFRVPGSFEIPVIARCLADGGNFDAIIALGAILKGETKHDEFLAQAVIPLLCALSTEFGIPIGMGIITAHTDEIALARARADKNNRGYHAARSAIEMAKMMKRV